LFLFFLFFLHLLLLHHFLFLFLLLFLLLFLTLDQTALVPTNQRLLLLFLLLFLLSLYKRHIIVMIDVLVQPCLCLTIKVWKDPHDFVVRNSIVYGLVFVIFVSSLFPFPKRTESACGPLVVTSSTLGTLF